MVHECTLRLHCQVPGIRLLCQAGVEKALGVGWGIWPLAFPQEGLQQLKVAAQQDGGGVCIEPPQLQIVPAARMPWGCPGMWDRLCSRHSAVFSMVFES